MTPQEKLMNELINIGFIKSNEFSDPIVGNYFLFYETQIDKNDLKTLNQVVVMVYSGVGGRLAQIFKFVNLTPNKKRVFFVNEYGQTDEKVNQEIIDYVKKLQEWSGEDETSYASNK